MPSGDSQPSPTTGPLTRLGIVVPAFNAAQTIEPTLRRLPVRALRGSGVRATAYVVDDGSTDRTAKAARTAARKVAYPVQILEHERNRGYGAAHSWTASS